MTIQDLPNDNDVYVAGDSAVLEITVENKDGTTRDISGYSAEFALSDYPGNATHVEKSTSSGGVSIVNGPNGRLDVDIDAGDTSDLGDHNGEKYHYEVELTDGSGSVVTVAVGDWTIYADTI